MGWIKVDRDILEHFIWSDEKFDRGHAWIDLLLLANHEDRKIMIQGSVFVIKRGQHLTSVRKLAKRWGWCEEKVLNFLKMLEQEKMILRDVRTLNGTLLTIVNYGKFQDKANTKPNTNQYTEQHTDKHTELNTEQHTEPVQTRNIKNNKEYKEVEEDYRPSDEEWELMKQEGFDD